MIGIGVVIGLGVIFGVGELVSFILSSWLHQDQYTKASLQHQLYTVAHINTVSTTELLIDRVKPYVSGNVPHPYVGFVQDPEKNTRINNYGWWGPTPLTKRRPGTVVIALFGGSVAENIYLQAGDSLVQLLQHDPVFSGKNIELVTTALGGYKQPQQALALEYLLAQGAEYDIVLNIDGFNEVTLPGTDNYWQHVAPIFPRSWNWYSQTLLNAKTLYLVVPLYVVNDMRINLARLYQALPLRYVSLFLLSWRQIDAQLEYASRRISEKLRNIASSSVVPYQSRGPDIALMPDDLVDYSVSIWKNSSLQMAALAAAGDSLYIHVLQPTVYFEGSKQLTAEEKKNAFIDDTPSDIDSDSFQYLAANGYPKMVQIGNQYLKQHEYFFDATQIFSAEQENMYVDMCHQNEQGMDILVKFVAQSVIFAYANRAQTVLK